VRETRSFTLSDDLITRAKEPVFPPHDHAPTRDQNRTAIHLDPSKL
jgi:hypothetical protein